MLLNELHFCDAKWKVHATTEFLKLPLLQNKSLCVIIYVTEGPDGNVLGEKNERITPSFRTFLKLISALVYFSLFNALLILIYP